ncbi:MAG: TIGR02757 family protein [Elusimicrobia bacterium GWC2_51_8]|nr:MAG: TIGR02757 family protein [Elusimicrobia bacterium GWC2_51_8]HAF95044.1 TIGR02757 family protein [Elusimicrobiota bacterium]HCE98705.1 TIGR02757 family protein [Elusimicrobiota bacterium]
MADIHRMIPDRQYFETAYRKFNRPEFIHPDPLEFVWRYNSAEDREIAGFIAAALAYGNVRQIIKSVEKVLAPMGKSPALYLRGTPEKEISKTLLNFKHRFTTGAEMAIFLLNIKAAVKNHGSLENCFLKNYKPKDEDLSASLYAFVNELNSRVSSPTLIPCPEKKSSFKRVNLYLRWMVRRDAVDPGVWTKIPPSKLIVPLDTHMFQVSKNLGLTGRNDTSMKTALEITAAFRRVSPEDPVKYDFALTRTGILKI